MIVIPIYYIKLFTLFDIKIKLGGKGIYWKIIFNHKKIRQIEFVGSTFS